MLNLNKMFKADTGRDDVQDKQRGKWVTTREHRARQWVQCLLKDPQEWHDVGGHSVAHANHTLQLKFRHK